MDVEKIRPAPFSIMSRCFHPEEMDYWKECGCCVDMFADMLRDDGYDLTIFREVREESGCVSDVYVAMNNCRIIPA